MKFERSQEDANASPQEILGDNPMDSFCNDLEELLDACATFYRENEDKMELSNIQERRANLSIFIEKFHKDCGTLTSAVQKRIDDLKNDCVILMTAHQPNLFAYSGVFRKATLNFVLAKRLEKLLGVPVVNFFGVADQDFTDDRWVKSSLLPAVKRKGGVLTIEIKLPKMLMLNRVPKPSIDFLNNWKGMIKGWLDDAINSVDRFCKVNGLPRLGSTKPLLHGNFGSFCKIVEDAYARSATYSDFNAFVMSKIINEVWGYDTLFSRFSECQQIFAPEFSFLLSRFMDYSRSLKEASGLPFEKGIGEGVSDLEPQLVPFWYHCDCGSKVRLFYLAEQGGSVTGYGDCLGCKQGYKIRFGAAEKPDLSGIASRISARAIPMNLVFFKGLGVSCYVGGLGGLKYLMEARCVANELAIPFPPTPVWRPHDRYWGIGQMEALLEFKRISGSFEVCDQAGALARLNSRIAEARRDLDKLEAQKEKIAEKLRQGGGNETILKEKIRAISIAQGKIKRSSNLSVLIHDLKILENVPVALNLIPSIIDYAVNTGLKETSDQWIEYLKRNGDLSSNVHLKGVLNDLMVFDTDFFSPPNQTSDQL